MTEPIFQTTTHAKWSLTGEHAVLRGAPAVLFPSFDYRLELAYIAHEHPLRVVSQTPTSLSEPIVVSLNEQLREHLARTVPHGKIFQGTLLIHNTIPVGMGLGFSAAFSVALARWCAFQGWVPEAEHLRLAIAIEQWFHGRSSGMDVMAVGSEQPIIYQNGEVIDTLNPTWEPTWRITNSGTPSSTKACVVQVESWCKRNPALSVSVDADMVKSTALAVRGLQSSAQEGLSLLVASVQLAQQCFERWGLISDPVFKEQQSLRKMGALASKPIGAGGGGMVLSVWA